MSGIPSLSAALRNRRVRGMKGGGGGEGYGMSGIPSLSAVLRNRRVSGGGGLWDEWHPFTISSAPEQEGEGLKGGGGGGGEVDWGGGREDPGRCGEMIEET